MAEVLEVMIMIIKIMVCGVGAIISTMIFCVVAYFAANVIKAALQAVIEEIKERMMKRKQKKDNVRKTKGRDQKEKRQQKGTRTGSRKKAGNIQRVTTDL